MSDPTRKPADHAVPSPEPRPHGDPLTGGAPPAGDEAARTAEAAEASADGAGGADVPPVDAAASEAAPDAPADAAGAGDAAPDPVAVAEAKAQEYLDLAQRKQAEFENFRRRMNREVAQAEDRGVSRLVKELLPALDHLELALQAAEQSDPTHPGSEWVKGIRLVQDEVTGALGRVGIQAYAPVGEPFDPNEHEAMAQVPADGVESGNVAQVYQAGYRLNGAVLRPARVVVAQ